MSNTNWFQLNNPREIASPGLLVFKDRIAHNINLMVAATGDAKKLRPHIKTHKMEEVIAMQVAAGITKFKCATIAEAELLATSDAQDILLAMQPIGPNISRFFNLKQAFPHKYFACLVDNEFSLNELSKEAKSRNTTLAIFIDLDVGMSRTGISPEDSFELIKEITKDEFVQLKGLHVYDGHIRISNIDERFTKCNEAFVAVDELLKRLDLEKIQAGEIVAGGSPTFYVHAKRPKVIASPGTTLLWDQGYGSKFPDMEFKHAAVLVTRLLSKPKPNQFCLDLGHKALASEMPFPRVKFLNTDDFEQISQSEEHFVVKVSNPEKYQIGDVFYAVPLHVCPTVAKYPKVTVVENGEIIDSWKVAARDHKITY